MRDYLTLSWARFSKDVQSHTLQISKILAHPAPRAGELIKLDASLTPLSGRSSAAASGTANNEDTSLEVIARFPGGLDFGRGLVDINFTMWPLFKCLNIDNVLTVCEVRSLFFFHVCHLLSLSSRSRWRPPVVSYFSLGILQCSASVSSFPSSCFFFYFLSMTDCCIYHQISRRTARLERHCSLCGPRT